MSVLMNHGPHFAIIPRPRNDFVNEVIVRYYLEIRGFVTRDLHYYCIAIRPPVPLVQPPSLPSAPSTPNDVYFHPPLA